jgi:hypothetical protein
MLLIKPLTTTGVPAVQDSAMIPRDGVSWGEGGAVPFKSGGERLGL